MIHHSTREAWLIAAVDLLRPHFAAKGHPIPANLRLSCGFASTGLRSHHIGQCWSKKSSNDGVNQIYISPTLGDAIEVLDTLVHELVHAIDDCQHKHGKEFKKIALKIGLEGPMRSAGAGAALKAELQKLAIRLGPYPHGALKMTHRKTISVARARAKCEKCGYQVPMYKRFIEYGPPICPKDHIAMTPVGNWD